MVQDRPAACWQRVSLHPLPTASVDHPQSLTRRAAGSVGIPPAAQDKARGQASPAQTYLRTAAAGHVLRSLCWLSTASERAAQPSGAEYRANVCTNASLSSDIFTTLPRSAKLSSFVPLLIFIATKGPSETAGPFSCGAPGTRALRRMASLISAL